MPPTHENSLSSAPPEDLLIEVILVTPEQAAAWLEKSNTRNRNVRDHKVTAYARDMAAARWYFNGDTVCFDRDDTLLDGQHRLWAIVTGGVAVWCIVVYNLDPTTQETMDLGARRTFGDALSLRGEVSSTILAAIARRVLRYDAGFRSQGGPLVVTHQEMSAYIAVHPEIRRAVEVAQLARQASVPGASSMVGTAYHICARIDLAAAEKFYVDQLIETVGLQMGDPARVLLRRLQEEHKASGRPMNPDDAFRLTCLAWNHFRAGRQVTKLQSPKGGWTPSNFPEPK